MCVCMNKYLYKVYVKYVYIICLLPVPTPECSSFPLSLIVGLVCGTLLIILLLLLFLYRTSKGDITSYGYWMDYNLIIQIHQLILCQDMNTSELVM